MYSLSRSPLPPPSPKLRPFLYSSSVYSWHVFFISSALLGPCHFCPLSRMSLHEVFLGISNFHEEISSLSHSFVFLYLLHWSLRKAFFSLLAILSNSAFKWVYVSFSPLPFTSLLFLVIWKTSSHSHFAFIHFFFLGWFWAQCHEPWTIVLQALCVTDIIPWIYLSLPLYNHKGFDLVLSECSSGFPYFLQFKCEFGNKEFMVCATVSSWSCFCWLCRNFPSLAAKNIINLVSALTIWWCPCVESSLVLLEEGVCYIRNSPQS